MNIPDLILIIVALFSIWLGVQKGFINATADLLIWLGSIVTAFLGYPHVARIFGRIAQASPWLLPASFLSILLVSGFLLSWLARRLLRDLPPSIWKSRVNHAFGLLPGIVNAFITTSIVALLFVSVPFSDTFSDQAEASRAVAILTPPAEWAQEKLTPVFDEAIKRSMTKMTVEPESDETVTLPFRDSTVKERPDLEAKMLELVNEERVSRGLKALAPDTAMRRVAIAHSRDMFARGYFAHETPEKKSPFDRMKAAHIRYMAAGENLALARTLAMAHTGLMNSPGHRANILNRNYGRLGIGIIDGGRHGLMVSQEFRN
jgi:uncharacterized protein YkwD